MCRVLGEVTSAPKGTQYRVDEQSQWLEASVGTELYEDYEVRNLSGSYGVEISYEVEVEFDALTSVTFGIITGQAIYLDQYQEWQKASSSSQVNALSVASGENSVVPVTVADRNSKIKTRPW
jgi:hypothetical protein